MPEPRIQSPDKYLVPFSERFHRPSTLFLQKQSDAQEPDPALFTPPPPTRYEPQPFVPQDDGRGRYRSFGLITTFVLALAAFLIGGGIGGGVGGAIAAKNQAKIQSLESSIASAPTATITAPASTSTVILDTAGCPLVNNSTYNSTTPGYEFLRLCAIDITTPAGSNSIDVSNSQQSTFESCLDACANYNQNVQKGGCVGASWVIFSPTQPTQNSICFLKNATGVQTSASVDGQTVVSGFLQKSP